MITLTHVGTTIEDRLILGDVSALEDMYARHGALIHAITGVLDSDSRDRLTASIFADAWEARRDFDPSRGSVQAWLVRSVRRTCPMGPESERRVDELVVAGTISAMDEVQREILIEGSSASGQTEDLAERLDLPVGTVESHLRRGIRRIQAELVDSRDDGDDSRLAAIVRSGRLEAQLPRPSEDVWRHIAELTGADETVPMATESFALERPAPADHELDWGELDDGSTSNDDDGFVEANADGGDVDTGLGVEQAADGAGAIGLVDEFSATEFPGREPIQPDFGRDTPLDEPDAADDIADVDDDIGPADGFPAEDGPDSDDSDDDVPYILSGRYKPGVDDDPYADRQATGSELGELPLANSEVTDAAVDETTDGGSASEAEDRLAQAESAYFAEENRPDDSALAAPGGPWLRIAIVAVAAALLIAIILSLG